MTERIETGFIVAAGRMSAKCTARAAELKVAPRYSLCSIASFGRRCRRPSEASRPRNTFGCSGASFFVSEREEERMVKVEAMVIRERVETVIDAVEHATGHVGVTVIEAIGNGRERGVTHEYSGRVFESRFL